MVKWMDGMNKERNEARDVNKERDSERDGLPYLLGSRAREKFKLKTSGPGRSKQQEAQNRTNYR